MNQTTGKSCAPRRFLSWWLIVLPFSIIFYFISVVSFYEFYRIGILSEPSEIEEYSFGGEAMIGHGGWKYASASAYSFSTLIGGILLAATIAVQNNLNV